MEESTSQPEQNVQHMGRCVATVGKLIVFILFCLQGKVNAKQISVVQESQFEESESEDELFMVKEVGTVTQS